LKFGILVIPLVVPHGTPQARKNEPFLPYNPGTDVDGAGMMGKSVLARPQGKKILPVFIIIHFFYMVISEYKKEGFIEAGNDKFQVIHGEVPGAEDNVNIFKPFFYGIGVYQGIDLIGYTEYFHVCCPANFPFPLNSGAWQGVKIHFCEFFYGFMRQRSKVPVKSPILIL
jgi:hypothetical protein